MKCLRHILLGYEVINVTDRITDPATLINLYRWKLWPLSIMMT